MEIKRAIWYLKDYRDKKMKSDLTIAINKVLVHIDKLENKVQMLESTKENKYENREK